MAGPVVTNWFGDLVSHPRVVVEARSVEDIVAVMRNPETYPSPVRTVASNHSTARGGRRNPDSDDDERDPESLDRYGDS